MQNSMTGVSGVRFSSMLLVKNAMKEDDLIRDLSEAGKASKPDEEEQIMGVRF